MNIFIVSPGQDTGGQGARIAKAFKKYYPTWSVKAMRVSDNWIHFPHDLEWNQHKAKRLYQEADVVHHQNGLHLYATLDEGQHKPTVIHHHGTRLRTNPQGVVDESNSIGATGLVSTVDLRMDYPEATWVPQPCDIEEMNSYRVNRKSKKSVVRIGHAPTNRLAKNTDGILKTLNILAQRYDIEVDLIEGVEWKACLSRKARCDIFIDQVTLGYGNNGVEAMAMGIPVISGWNNPDDRELFIRETGVTPQFVEATHATLADALEPLIVSSTLREEWGERGRSFIELIHAEEKVINKLVEIYQRVPPSQGELRIYQPRKKERTYA